MADDEKAGQLSIKDIVVAIPIFASALAVAWEIGFFVRIRGGAFGFFSLAEHLNFALPALPVALAITAAGAIALVRDQIVELLPTTRSRFLARIRTRTGATISLLISMTLGVAIALYWLSSSFEPMMAILILGALAPYFWVRYLPVEVTRNPFVQSMVALVIFFCAMFAGFEMARNEVRSQLPLNVIRIGEKGKDAETEVKVRIMRTGERGVLYFDPGTQTFALIPWEIIRRIDWGISPLLRRR